MNFSHYLPNTRKRLARFKDIINHRPVAILLPGYSIYELADRIEDLRDCDICYAGVNRWLPLEQDILSKIDKQVSILFCAAPADWFIEDICSYLERKEENVYIAERMDFKEFGGENLTRLYENYNEKLLFFTSFVTEDKWPNRDFPLHILRENSLSILTALITIAEPRTIVFFGADGGRIEEEGLYYKAINEFTHPDGLRPEDSIERDTGWFNNDMMETLARVRKTYGVRECEIINCSERSFLEPFPRWSYNDTIKYLRRIS